MNFLTDFLGNASSGRALSWICVGLAYLCWASALWIPGIEEHARQGMSTFGYLSLAFYGVAKAPEGFAAFQGWLQTKVESKEKQ